MASPRRSSAKIGVIGITLLLLSVTLLLSPGPPSNEVVILSVPVPTKPTPKNHKTKTSLEVGARKTTNDQLASRKATTSPTAPTTAGPSEVLSEVKHTEKSFDNVAASAGLLNLGPFTPQTGFTAFETLQLSPKGYQQLVSDLKTKKQKMLMIPDEKNNKRSPCPSRYVFVNTHTYGRHHNQLQEMLNLAMWGREKLNRTAVLGWFRHQHRWHNPSDFYDFSAIMHHYCLISPEEFVSQKKKLMAQRTSSGGFTTACLGQGVEGTPLKSARWGKIKCNMKHPKIPPHYSSRNGFKITQSWWKKDKMFFDNEHTDHFDLLVLGGEVAFFMRGGIFRMAQIFSLLKPAKEIEGEISQFVEKNNWKQKEESIKNKEEDGGKISSTAAAKDKEGKNNNVKNATQQLPSLSYFSVHLRQREKECRGEVSNALEDGATFFMNEQKNSTKKAKKMSLQLSKGASAEDEGGKRGEGGLTNAQKIVLRTQCAVTLNYVMTLRKVLNIKTTISRSTASSSSRIDSKMFFNASTFLKEGEGEKKRGKEETVGLFLASDHQNQQLEQQLVMGGAVMYTGGKFHTHDTAGGLKGLAVDFFIMSRGKYFTGNQLSSVTQNACFLRLGLGMGCHGVVKVFSAYHARSIDGDRDDEGLFLP